MQPVDPQVGALLFFKMIQSEDFAFHHDQDLDKHHISIDIINETRQVSFTKRLYFNKAQLPIGYIDIRLKDRLKLQFSVIKRGAETDKKKLI